MLLINVIKGYFIYNQFNQKGEEMKKIILAVCLFCMAGSAYALESMTGKVTLVEGTYMPGTITFHMLPDTPFTTCKGAWLKWSNPNIENNKAVYSLLMTALVSGKKINFYIGDGDTNCMGRFIHLVGN